MSAWSEYLYRMHSSAVDKEYRNLPDSEKKEWEEKGRGIATGKSVYVQAQLAAEEKRNGEIYY